MGFHNRCPNAQPMSAWELGGTNNGPISKGQFSNSFVSNENDVRYRSRDILPSPTVITYVNVNVTGLALTLTLLCKDKESNVK